MEVPFSVQWIQTDRDSQFFAEKVRRRLMDEANRFRPIPLRWPHVTGTVERAHRRVTDELWAVADPKAADVVRTTQLGSTTTIGIARMSRCTGMRPSIGS